MLPDGKTSRNVMPMSTHSHVTESADPAAPLAQISPEELLRADLYDVLAALLSKPPNAELLKKTKALQGDDSDIGKAISALARIAKAVTEKSVTSEYNALFIGLGRGELLPFASFYLTGFLNEKPLALLRQDMSDIGIERQDDVFEPEDHIATICEIMSGLIRGSFGEPQSVEDQKRFFESHVGTWAGHFFEDLEAANGSVFYAPVGTIGRALMEIETEAFRMES